MDTSFLDLPDVMAEPILFAIERLFIDWQRPRLTAFADWYIDEFFGV